METVLIIGAGRLGTSLYRAIKESTKSRVLIKTNRTRTTVNNSNVSQNDRTATLNEHALNDVTGIILTVQDTEIPNIVGELQPFNLNDKWVIHTSGVETSELLTPLIPKGAAVGSWHPLQSFPAPFQPKGIWQGITCTYEGHETPFQWIQMLCARLGCRCHKINAKHKTAVHLAAVIAGNFPVALLSWSQHLLQTAGIDKTNAKAISYPLFERVIRNYKDKTPGEILSGPLSRGDLSVVEKHLNFLNSQNQHAYLESYRTLTRLLLSISELTIINREEFHKLIDGE